MFATDARAARITWTVFLIALLIGVIWLVREAILIFVVGLFLAYMLYPAVSFLHGRTNGKLSWVGSLAITFVLLIALTTFLVIWLGGQVVDQAQSLSSQLPELVRKSGGLQTLPVPSWLEPYRDRIIVYVREEAAHSTDRVMPLLQKALGGLTGLLGGLIYLLVVPILAFLFLKDAAEIRTYLLGWAPPNRQNTASRIIEDVHYLLAQYIRALAILSLLTAIAYGVFLAVVGMPYALLLSLAAAILEFIPFVGPLLGMVLILLVAVFTGFPHIWWIPVFYLAYRVVQDYVIQPHLMASGVQLHPLVVFFGALAGEAVGGLWGVFLSVPVLAALRILLIRSVRWRNPPDRIVEVEEVRTEA